MRDLGEPAAVLQLLARHNRNCAAVAERLGVLHVKVPDTIPGSPFEAIPALRPSRLAGVGAVVARAARPGGGRGGGYGPAYTGGLAPVGMHIFLRATPPGRIRGRQPEHLLVGHGSGVHGAEAATGLEQAYERSRGDLPAVIKTIAGQLLKR